MENGVMCSCFKFSCVGKIIRVFYTWTNVFRIF